MLHIKDNIKIIRKLWALNQRDFASLFSSVDLNKQKYVERNTKAPDVLYMQELEDLTGISQKDLLNKN